MEAAPPPAYRLLPSCQDDREFRDKITPISVVMEYQLDYQQAADKSGLQPIIDTAAPPNVTKQVRGLQSPPVLHPGGF